MNVSQRKTKKLSLLIVILIFLISVCDKYINILNTVKKNISDEADSLRIEDTLLSIKEEKIKYQYQKEKLLSKLSKLVNQEIKDVSAEFTTRPLQEHLSDFVKGIYKSPYYLSAEKDIEKLKEVYKLSKTVFYPDFTIRARIDTGGSLTDAFSFSGEL